jgi:hypothetical protein
MFCIAPRPSAAQHFEDKMTLKANYAGQAASVETKVANTEKRDTVIFFVLVFALVATVVVTGLTVGLAGVGMIAMLATAAMLLICLLLTAG